MHRVSIVLLLAAGSVARKREETPPCTRPSLCCTQSTRQSTHPQRTNTHAFPVRKQRQGRAGRLISQHTHQHPHPHMTHPPRIPSAHTPRPREKKALTFEGTQPPAPQSLALRPLPSWCWWASVGAMCGVGWVGGVGVGVGKGSAPRSNALGERKVGGETLS